MKQSVALLALCGAFVLTTTTTFGQAGPPVFIIDEYGGSIGLPPGIVGPDPSGGIPPAISPVLFYPVPFPVISGDVLLTEEPGPNPTQFSDVVRFWNPAGVNQSFLIFYSEPPEPGSPEIPPPADIGLPAQLQPLVFGPIPEIGTDAFNYADYLALPGMPGWDGNPLGTKYTFISDGRVPEPGSCALLGLGGLLALMKWRKRN